MTDEAAIRQLQNDYCTYFDARDAENYANLYTEDCIVVTPWGQEIHGSAKMAKAVKHTPLGGWHKAGAYKVEISGDDAQGTCRFEAQDLDGSIDEGYYEDRYRRVGDQWQIAYRRVIVETRDMSAPQRPK